MFFVNVVHIGLKCLALSMFMLVWEKDMVTNFKWWFVFCMMPSAIFSMVGNFYNLYKIEKAKLGVVFPPYYLLFIIRIFILILKTPQILVVPTVTPFVIVDGKETPKENPEENPDENLEPPEENNGENHQNPESPAENPEENPDENLETPEENNGETHQSPETPAENPEETRENPENSIETPEKPEETPEKEPLKKLRLSLLLSIFNIFLTMACTSAGLIVEAKLEMVYVILGAVIAFFFLPTPLLMNFLQNEEKKDNRLIGF